MFDRLVHGGMILNFIPQTHPSRASLLRSFEELASTESDCSSYKRGGDLGPFARGKMQKSFEDAAFALSVGEMSGVVLSESGAHIILRLE